MERNQPFELIRDMSLPPPKEKTSAKQRDACESKGDLRQRMEGECPYKNEKGGAVPKGHHKWGDPP